MVEQVSRLYTSCSKDSDSKSSWKVGSKSSKGGKKKSNEDLY